MIKTIIQDYKNLKNARQAEQLVVMHINCFKENLVHECDEETWKDNVEKEKLFDRQSLPDDFGDAVNALMHISHYINTTNKLAQKYRASSCFYRCGEKEGRCINLSLNVGLTDKRCDGCDKHLLLKNYQSIFAELLAKKQKCENAKRKLLSNFIFWKQITK